MSDDSSALDQILDNLASCDVDDLRKHKTKNAARAELARAMAREPRTSHVSRILEPALVGACALALLAWVVRGTWVLLGG